MSKRSRRSTPPASHPTSAPDLFTARLRELNTKRRGELAELAFTLKAARLGFGVSRPFGDSERYDAIIDARELSPSRRHSCPPTCPTLQSFHRRKTARATNPREPERESQRESECPTLRGVRRVRSTHVATGASAVPRRKASGIGKGVSLDCPALRTFRHFDRKPSWCGRDGTPPLWRVQVKCSTQLENDMYHLNAHRRTGGRAVPYFPGEIDFLAAYIIPEDTWYIIPLEAFLGSTSLLFRRRNDPKPGLYDEYKEAWHLLRPK
jgi:hypothetical protein